MHFNDGFTWKTMKPVSSTWARGYLWGFTSAYVGAVATKLSKESQDYAIYSKFTGVDCPQHGQCTTFEESDVLHAIDKFYDNPQNQDTCLNHAIEFSAARLAGNPYPDSAISIARDADKANSAKGLHCPGL